MSSLNKSTFLHYDKKNCKILEPICTIDTDDLNVTNLTATNVDVTNLDAVVLQSECLKVFPPEPSFLVATKNNVNLVNGVEKFIDNYTLLSGTLPTFDTVAGTYTVPTGEDGLYLINVLVEIANANANTDIHILLKDSLNNVIYGVTNRLNNVVAPTYTFIANHDILYAGNNFKISLTVDTAAIVVNSVKLKITKALCYPQPE